MDIVESVKWDHDAARQQAPQQPDDARYYHWQYPGDCNGRYWSGSKISSRAVLSQGPNVLFVTPTRQARDTTFDLPKLLVLADGSDRYSGSFLSKIAPQINTQY